MSRVHRNGANFVGSVGSGSVAAPGATPRSALEMQHDGSRFEEVEQISSSLTL
jgi:hypothetical protein